MNTVAFFDEPADRSLVGGKGANLMALTHAGFAVPHGFVVLAGAYQRFMDTAAWLTGSVAELDYAHPEKLLQQCAQIRRRLKQAALPPAVRDEIANALGGLGDGPIAVRSSSTFEDLAQAAFAGQHDTYLNVRGLESVLERVRDCFASLWEDRAVLYRHHRGFSQTAARMAVVVQRQIHCQAAGVAFSIDPVAGRMDRMIVDANYGLGESVVSGEGEVDHFELAESSLQILTRSIGHKDRQIIPTPAGTEQRPVPADLADRQCITDEQVLAIATLLKRVAAHYGWPQDIEWGITGSTIHLLQSRPVTTIQPDWTRDESAERFPNPMTPLSWDFIRVAFDGSLKHSLALMGLPPLKGEWFAIFDHYIYGNQNAVRLMAMFRPLRARSAAELAAEIPALRRRFAWVSDLPVHWARDLDRYLLSLGRLQARPDPTTLAEAWDFVRQVLETASDYFLPNIAISMTQSGLHRLLHALIAMVAGPEKALVIVDGLLAGCETKTAQVNREIHELASLARHTDGLSQDLIARGRDARIADDSAFTQRLERFLSDHGHREIDMDYSIPTWSGDPGVVIDSIALLLRAAPGPEPAETMRSQRIRQGETERAFLAAVPEGLRFFFAELIRLTRTYTVLDDLEHYQTTRINPLAYRAAIALGRQLVKLSVLDRAQDVFFLNKSDVEELAADATGQLVDRCRQKAATNKTSYLAAKTHAPRWSRTAVAAAATGDKVLRGLPGSPGTAAGPCFQVHGPEDFGRFPPGSVLVARTTNPAWTPLFYAACAVVTESGGPLSHGAVTAREMGLPAVMAVREILSRVTNGQQVRVDGTNGTVELL